MTTRWEKLHGYWGEGVSLDFLDSPEPRWNFVVVKTDTSKHLQLTALIERESDSESGYELHLVAYHRGIELFDPVTMRYVDGFWTISYAQAFAETLAEKKLPPSWDGSWHGHVSPEAAYSLAEAIDKRDAV